MIVHIYVIDPFYMDLEITEYENNDYCWESTTMSLNYYKPKKSCSFENNWNLIKNRLYYLRISIYDQHKQHVFLTNDVKIEVNSQLISGLYIIYL